MLRHNRDHDLIQKIMILEGYVELKGINPDRTYDNMIRKALDDLTALVQLTDEVA